MTKFKRSTFFTPSAETYSKASIRWIGYDHLYLPCWLHALQWFILQALTDAMAIQWSKTKSSAFHKSHATDTPYTTNSLATARQQKYSIEGMSLFSDPHNRNPSPCDPNLTRFLLPPLIIDLLFNAVLFSTHATA
ncbi:hypothetical protein WN943_020363 [Citrus x changshan-huyou]